MRLVKSFETYARRAAANPIANMLGKIAPIKVTGNRIIGSISSSMHGDRRIMISMKNMALQLVIRENEDTEILRVLH